uniref:Plp n=1 Tax=Ganoderma boninense TaxID=34458 RepID=A0A5K1K6V0_9APHY|nr:Plp [Ganoderma boninense]
MALPATMSAVGLSKTGSLDDIEEFKFPVPSPSPTQILIKASGSSQRPRISQFVDGTDLPRDLPFPFAPGVDCLGTIVALPTDEGALSDGEYRVRGFAVGGKVVSASGAGIGGAGTFAEYLVAEWSDVFPVPDGISDRTVIASFAAERRGPRPHRRAHGGGRRRARASGRGVHAIFDGVGRDTFETDLACIRVKGTIVWLGFASGLVEPFAPHITGLKAVNAVAYSLDKKAGGEYVAEVFRLVASGAYKPVVYEEYPFSAVGVRETERL